MSIFGKLDAANIPSNPFFIEEGTYSATITDAKYKDATDSKPRQLVIDYTIDDELSEFLDSRATQFFDLVDPNMTMDDLKLLPADEQKKIRRNNSSLKRTLCGSNKNSGLGVKEDDLNDENWNPTSLKGLQVNIGIANYGPNKEGVQVRWASLRDS